MYVVCTYSFERMGPQFFLVFSCKTTWSQQQKHPKVHIMSPHETKHSTEHSIVQPLDTEENTFPKAAWYSIVGNTTSSCPSP